MLCALPSFEAFPHGELYGPLRMELQQIRHPGNKLAEHQRALCSLVETIQ